MIQGPIKPHQEPSSPVPLWREVTGPRVLQGVMLGVLTSPAGAALVVQGWAERIARGEEPSSPDVLVGQFLRVVALALLCGLLGSLLSRRYHLTGLGDPRRMLRRLPLLLGVGAVLATLRWLLVDRWLLVSGGGVVPRGAGVALQGAIAGAVYGEMVARYGMMTAFTGVLRRPMGAAFAVAVFFAVEQSQVFAATGHAWGWNGETALAMWMGISEGMALGWVYWRWGLWGAMMLRAVLLMRFVLYAAASWPGPLSVSPW